MLHATAEGRLAFDLPGVAPPPCWYELRSGKKDTVPTNLDTVIVNTNTRQVILLWRAHFALVQLATTDLVVLRVGAESPAAEVEIEVYGHAERHRKIQNRSLHRAPRRGILSLQPAACAARRSPIANGAPCTTSRNDSRHTSTRW